MRTERYWTWATALALGLGFCAAAQGDEDDEEEAPPRATFAAPRGSLRTTLGRLKNGGRGPATVKPPLALTKPAPRPVENPEKAIVPVRAETAPTDDEARERGQAEADYLRRQAVCQKLMHIAVSTNDRELQSVVESLDQQAWDLYQERTAHLKASAVRFESDEKVIEQYLGSEKTAAPATGLLAERKREAKSVGQAARREVKP